MINIITNQEIADVSLENTETLSVSNTALPTNSTGLDIMQNETIPNNIPKQVDGSDLLPRSVTMDKLSVIELDVSVAGFMRSGQTGYDAGIGFWLGTDAGTPKFSIGNSAGNKMTWNGTTLSIVGVVTVGSSVGGWTITATTIQDTAGTVGISSAVTGGDDIRFWAGHVTPASAPFYVTESGALKTSSITITGVQAGSDINGVYLSTGSVGSAAANIALQGWNITCAFSVTDLDAVAWGAGSVITANGTTYSIVAGNTGNMSARTYIYLDIATSTTVLQTTTTASTAVGNGKILVATAINGATEATFEVLGGVGGLNINASSIVAGSITANEIATGTISADRMNVSQLSAIAADLGTITAGTVTGATIQTDAAASTGIKFSNTGFKGYDSTNTESLDWSSSTGKLTATLASVTSPLFFQVQSPVVLNSYDGTAGETMQVFSANSDSPAAIYLVSSDSSASALYCYRFERNAIGTYIYSGTNVTVNATGAYAGGCVIGSYVYINYETGGTCYCKRYDLDLTGVQAMTFASWPGNKQSGYISTDGTAAYVHSVRQDGPAAGDFKLYKVTISGTNWTYDSVSTDADITGYNPPSYINSYADSTMVYLVDASGYISRFTFDGNFVGTISNLFCGGDANIERPIGIINIGLQKAIVHYLNISEWGSSNDKTCKLNVITTNLS